MSLLFTDGFDHYEFADRLDKWSVSEGFFADAFEFTTGRTGANALRLGESIGVGNQWVYIRKDLDVNAATIIVGMAIYPELATGGDDTKILQISDDDTNHVYVTLQAGTLKVFLHDDTLLGSASIDIGAWSYFEIKVIVHNSTGRVTARLNVTEFIDENNIDTQATVNAYANRVMIGDNSNMEEIIRVDDLYICDGAGGVNDDFLGAIKIQTLMPDGDGSSSTLTPLGGGDNYVEVDESPPDDDTSYVMGDAAGEKDMYTVEDLIDTDVNVLAAVVNTYTRLTETGLRTVAARALSGVTEGAGSAFTPATAYSFHQTFFETDPDTGVAWTPSGINAAAFGVSVES